MEYNSFLHITFETKDNNEMYERIWELERILYDNGYKVKAHHTAPLNSMRSVRVGSNPL